MYCVGVLVVVGLFLCCLGFGAFLFVNSLILFISLISICSIITFYYKLTSIDSIIT